MQGSLGITHLKKEERECRGGKESERRKARQKEEL